MDGDVFSFQKETEGGPKAAPEDQFVRKGTPAKHIRPKRRPSNNMCGGGSAGQVEVEEGVRTQQGIRWLPTGGLERPEGTQGEVEGDPTAQNG